MQTGVEGDQRKSAPRRSFWRALHLLLLFAFAVSIISCRPASETPSVVVYTALDQIYSEAILKRFEASTGIRVLAVYDTEATKTVGLVNRIIAESAQPRCDVFWNNEVVRTLVLKRRGLLEPYRSPSAEDIPDRFKDGDGCWAGFAARARIALQNTNMVSALPADFSILHLTAPEWKARVSMAYPLFGTTASHAAALFVTLGDAKARQLFADLRQNGVVIVDGNASAKDAVVRGETPLCLTDTDDAYFAMTRGAPVRMVFPDQGEQQMGVLLIPNTVAVIRNSPHPSEARKLVDFLLSREVEELLANCGSAQMPLRSGLSTPTGVPGFESIRTMAVDWEEVANQLETSTAYLDQLFVR